MDILTINVRHPLLSQTLSTQINLAVAKSNFKLLLPVKRVLVDLEGAFGRLGLLRELPEALFSSISSAS